MDQDQKTSSEASCSGSTVFLIRINLGSAGQDIIQEFWCFLADYKYLGAS